MFKHQLVFLFTVLLLNYADAQLLNFQLDPSMKLTGKYLDSTSTIYDYENDTSNVQITVYIDSSRYIACFSRSGGSHYEFDSEDRLLVMSRSFKSNPEDSTKYASTHVGQEFYVSGALKSYSIMFEKEDNEYDPPSLGMHKGSYFIEFHENGQLKNKTFFIDSKQERIEYWDNGLIKIKADYEVNGDNYCGKYKEYDYMGRLVAKGNYKDVGIFDYPMRKGIWKFYENGKCVKKTNYKKGVVFL